MEAVAVVVEEKKETTRKEKEDVVGHFPAETCVDFLGVFGNDATVVNAARVSFGAQVDENKPLDAKDERLIRFLASHKHDSPFFHVMVRLRIRMPIFVAREYFRHAVGFSRNEISRRYVTKEVECFLPREIRERNPSKKQGSRDTSIAENDRAMRAMGQAMVASIRSYRDLLAMNACPEQARMVLPQAMMTEFIETGSLAAYARMYALRSQSDAQLEIRLYAEQIGRVLEKHIPVAWNALVASHVANLRNEKIEYIEVSTSTTTSETSSSSSSFSWLRWLSSVPLTTALVSGAITGLALSLVQNKFFKK